MKPELDRVRNDLETIQKAIGLAPSFGPEFVRSIKRDNWMNLWWCLPGLILIASALARYDHTKKVFGLVVDQWVGVLVSGVLLGMAIVHNRTVMRTDVRPIAVIREYKRINAQGAWFGLAFLVQILFYFVWGKQYGIPGQPFMAGLWLLSGCSLLMLAVFTKAWVFLGWAIPLVAFGLCQPLLRGRTDGLWLGLMFIAAALLCWVIQAWQARGMEKRYDAH